ncbi:MAG: hypothetical protein QXO66_04360, partial [Thermofilum sp.]
MLSEVADFLKGRWVAFHCEKQLKDGRPVLVRYRRGRPLKASTPAELSAIMRKLAHLRPRAVYGTASIYQKLEAPEDVRS